MRFLKTFFFMIFSKKIAPTVASVYSWGRLDHKKETFFKIKNIHIFFSNLFLNYMVREIESCVEASKVEMF